MCLFVELWHQAVSSTGISVTLVPSSMAEDKYRKSGTVPEIPGWLEPMFVDFSTRLNEVDGRWPIFFDRGSS